MKKYWRIALLIIFYSVGIFGMLSNIPGFVELSALNLLISFALIIPFPGENRILLLSLAIILLGIVVEIIGVATGFPFGVYWYGTNLGPQIAGVPLIIGVNWAMLAYSSWIIAHPLVEPKWLRPIAAGGLMLLLDYLIEIMAGPLDFWHWKDEMIPLANYAAWFAVGAGFCALFEYLAEYKNNLNARVLYGLQLVFFAVLIIFKV